GLSCVLQPGHGACAAERRMCKVWVVMILGRGRCFARGPTAVHNMGRVVRDSHPGEQGARAADPEVLTPASRERPPGAPGFSPQDSSLPWCGLCPCLLPLTTSRRRLLRLSLKDRNKTVAVVVWRGRVDKPSKRPEVPVKSQFLLSKTEARKTKTLEIRTHLPDSRRRFPRSPPAAATIPQKGRPGMWATRFYSTFPQR